MQDEGLIANLYRVTGIVPALIADDDVEALSEQVDYLTFSFIAPLGADDSDNHAKMGNESILDVDTKQARLRTSRNRASVVLISN